MPNPMLRRVPRDEMTERMRAEYDAAEALRDDATLNAVGANAPELMQWYKDEFYGKLFYGGRVPTRLKELLRYRLSMAHGCAYCNKGNSAAALRSGVTPEQLRAILDEDAPCFDARERAVLGLADQIAMTNMHGHLDASLYAALKPFFDDAQIFELGMVAGILTGMAKFLFVYDLVEKEAHCPVVQLDPAA
ncbi:MAG: carboxymuconolactone decarboxylase family protein [Burkholderiales bacterium]|nr:MAG: carboxymuconolactone decarboxylase family protein [Burkholderiales bacterium]